MTAYMIEDRRGGKRFWAWVGAFLVSMIAAGLVSGGLWLGAFFVGVLFASMARGVGVVVPTNDPTMRFKVYGRPLWLCVAVLVLGLANLTLMKPDYSDRSLTLPSMLVGLIPVVWAAIQGWRELNPETRARIKEKMKRKPKEDKDGNPAPKRARRVKAGPTDEDLVMGRGTQAMLTQAGMGIKSPASGMMIAPEILRSGVDQHNRVWMDVRIIAGRQTVTDYIKAAERIASAWQVPRVEVTDVSTAGQPHTVRLTAVLREDMLPDGPIPWQPIPLDDRYTMGVPPVVEWCSRIPMGVWKDTGEDYYLNLAEKNVMAAGRPGSGKSSGNNNLLASLSLHPDVRIGYMDLKAGVESAKWAPRLDMELNNLAGDAVAVPAAVEFINAAVADMRSRYGRMAAAGITNAWTQTKRDGSPFLGADEPVKVLVIDECSELFKRGSDNGKTAAAVEEALSTYIKQGRAAGYVLVIMTQKPSMESLPTGIRDNVSDRWAYKMASPNVTAVTLGGGFIPETPALDPTLITSPGDAVVVNDDYPSGRPVRMLWLDEGTRDELMEFTDQHRREWLDAVAAPDLTDLGERTPEPEPVPMLEDEAPASPADEENDVGSDQRPERPSWGI